MSARSRAQVNVRVRIVNQTGRSRTVALEPWGDVYEMPSGAEWEIRGEGPALDTLEIVFEEDRTTVYGWPGSVVSIYSDGQEVGESRVEGHTPAPA